MLTVIFFEKFGYYDGNERLVILRKTIEIGDCYQCIGTVVCIIACCFVANAFK